MQLKLTRHVQDMISYRSLSIDHIKKAVTSPDKTEDAYQNKIKVTKNIEGKIIKVVYCKEGFRDKKNEVLVITAYYLEE